MKYIRKVLYIIVLIIGIILGLIIRSWSSINWSQMDYGSVADWVSGLGTIGAIVGSVIFFYSENKAQLKMNIIFKNDGSKMELTVSNNGRQTGYYQYWGIKVDKGELRRSSGTGFIRLKNNGILDNEFKFEMVDPGRVSMPITLTRREIFTRFDIYKKDSNIFEQLGVDNSLSNINFDFKIAIVDGNKYIHEKIIKVRKGILSQSADIEYPYKRIE